MVIYLEKGSFLHVSTSTLFNSAGLYALSLVLQLSCLMIHTTLYETSYSFSATVSVLGDLSRQSMILIMSQIKTRPFPRDFLSGTMSAANDTNMVLVIFRRYYTKTQYRIGNILVLRLIYCELLKHRPTFPSAYHRCRFRKHFSRGHVWNPTLFVLRFISRAYP